MANSPDTICLQTGFYGRKLHITFICCFRSKMFPTYSYVIPCKLYFSYSGQFHLYVH